MILRIRSSSAPETTSASRSYPGAHLPVDAVDRPGARVDEDLTAGVPLGVEVEAALVRPLAEVRTDVADEEGVRERLPVEADAEQAAQDFAPGARARHHMGAANLHLPVGRPTGEGDARAVLLESDHLVVPPHLDQRGGLHRGVHELLGPGLGDVHERRQGEAPRSTHSVRNSSWSR